MLVHTMTIKLPCVRGFFGENLETFVTQVQPSQIKALLGHDPQSKNWKRLPAEQRELYEYLQRKTPKSRRAGVRSYIEHRISGDLARMAPGFFNDITVAVTQPLKYTDFSEEYPHITEGVGVIDFPMDDQVSRVLVDGMARVSGALEAIEDGNLEAASSFSLGVCIVAPKSGRLDKVALGQIFHDLNFMGTHVSAAQAIDLDRSDVHVMATNKLAEMDTIREAGGMAARSTTLKDDSFEFVTQRTLLRFVRGACEGFAATKTINPIPIGEATLEIGDISERVKLIEGFLSTLQAVMGRDNFLDRDGVHLTNPGWSTLGVICHDMQVRLAGRLTVRDDHYIMNRLGRIDWSRSNPEWVPMIGVNALDTRGEPIKDAQGRTKLGVLHGGQKAQYALTRHLRQVTGLQAHLDALEAETEVAAE